MTRIAKVDHAGINRLAVVETDGVRLLQAVPGCHTFTDFIHQARPAEAARQLSAKQPLIPFDQVRFLAPIDNQEVWAAGVTYKRSQVARMEESETGASHYDRVYTAPRPELFFKATRHRVVGPDDPIRIRTDTKWSVPEPEFTLVLRQDMKLVGYTIGNDMSARDIEGENPLYLPQAKVYDACCALGPGIVLADTWAAAGRAAIRLTIRRAGSVAFQGETDVTQMARTFEELIGWLARDNSFPTGVILLTGTGIIPPDDFTLEPGDVVEIAIDGLGTLINTVRQGA